MISICMGRSYGRATMEHWFTRAMLANPDNLRACEAKSVYLYPQWFGNETDALEFGRECLKSGTAGNRIPIVLVDVHDRLAANSHDKDAYYAQPGVWSDIDAVYKKLLSGAEPDVTLKRLRLDRAQYIQYAYDCHQWQALLDLMDKFKDDIDFNVIGGKGIYAFYKTKAKQQLAKAPV